MVTAAVTTEQLTTTQKAKGSDNSIQLGKHLVVKYSPKNINQWQ